MRSRGLDGESSLPMELISRVESRPTIMRRGTEGGLFVALSTACNLARGSCSALHGIHPGFERADEMYQGGHLVVILARKTIGDPANARHGGAASAGTLPEDGIPIGPWSDMVNQLLAHSERRRRS